MRTLPSGSSIHRAMECDASTVLPVADRKSDGATLGDVRHRFLADLQKNGRDDALAAVPEEHRAMCEAIDTDAILSSTQAAAEVAYAYNPQTGKARELGRDIGRRYAEGGLKEDEVPMTLDVVALLGPDTAYVLDYKSGYDAHTAPAFRNIQLRTGAVAVCRAYGRSKAVVEIIRIYPDGRTWRDKATLDALDIDSWELELQRWTEKVRHNRAEYAAGVAPRATVGEHCKYCPSLPFCPAQVSLVRQLASAPEEVQSDLVTLLTPGHAAKALERLKVAKDVLKHVEAALKDFAQQSPIDLGNGSFYGPVQMADDEIVPEKAMVVMVELFGEDVARSAIQSKATKTSIEKALGPIAKLRGIKATQLKADVLLALEKAGALVRGHKTEIREHKQRSQ